MNTLNSKYRLRVERLRSGREEYILEQLLDGYWRTTLTNIVNKQEALQKLKSAQDSEVISTSFIYNVEDPSQVSPRPITQQKQRP